MREVCDPPAMGTPPKQNPSLAERLREAGTRLGRREAEHGRAVAEAGRIAKALRARVAEALEAFHAAAEAAGAPHLRVDLGPVRTDDKHLRAVQFDLARGRHRAVVTVKSRGEVTLVGPFRAGRTEGPCLSFPTDQEDEIETALAGFLERFVEEAATP